LEGFCSNLVQMFQRGVAYDFYQLVAPPTILLILWHFFYFAASMANLAFWLLHTTSRVPWNHLVSQWMTRGMTTGDLERSQTRSRWRSSLKCGYWCQACRLSGAFYVYGSRIQNVTWYPFWYTMIFLPNFHRSVVSTHIGVSMPLCITFGDLQHHTIWKLHTLWGRCNLISLLFDS